MHSSGVHGVEGYSGSAIQHKLLSTLPKWYKNDENQPVIMFVHAVNPFGMALNRRFNENSVDINRNYKTKEEWDTFHQYQAIHMY